MRSKWRELAHSNYLLNLAEIRQGKDHLDSVPFQFMVDLIGVCNMRPHCCMCVLDESNPSVHPGLDRNAFDHIHGLFERCSYITDCSTGEVLLHPHLFAFLDLIDAKGKAIGLTSNAVLLTKKTTERLLPYSRSLYFIFSLDASSNATYQKLRGPHFDRVCSNIANYCHERRRTSEPLMTDVGLCFIPMRCNRHEIPSFFDLAGELGADYVLFTSLYSRPVNKIERRDNFVFDYYHESLDFHELEECRSMAIEASLRTGIEFRCQYNITGEQVAQELKPPEVSDVDAPCVMPWRYAKLVHNGETNPCLYILESMGNWKKDRFESIWNGKEWREIRLQLVSGQLAEQCFNASSCPIVRCYRHRSNGEAATADLLRRARTNDGYLIDVCDNEFQQFIITGVHPIEHDPRTGQGYRWLDASATIRLPSLPSGTAHEVIIHGQTHKPNIEEHPIHTIVTVDGEVVGNATFVDAYPTAICFPLNSASHRPLVEITSTHCWRPADYWQDSSGDRRLLSFRTSTIAVVPRRE